VNSGLYSEFANNKPSKLGLRALRFQQFRLLKTVVLHTGEIDSVLEIGPGWGAFAVSCRNLGIEYEFVDNSPAVANLITSEGFTGICGTTANLKEIRASTIWMSHVLEHSPTWCDARNMLAHLSDLAPHGTRLVIIGPDVTSWRTEFFNCDSTHGYPTTLRNVMQLVQDVGFTVSYARHHRLASWSPVVRFIALALYLIPWKLMDRFVIHHKRAGRSGFFYNFKVNFLLRQICVIACK